MNFTDLRKHFDPPPHARRAGIDSPPYRTRAALGQSARHASPERLSLADALRDPEIDAALQETADNEEDEEYHHGVGDTGFHCEPPFHDGSLPPVENGRTVTISNDEDAGPEESSSPNVVEFRLQRQRLARRRFDTENWEREERWAGLDRSQQGALIDDVGGDSRSGLLTRLDTMMARSRVDDTSSTSPDTPRPAREPARDGGPPDEGKRDDTVKCARFRIIRGKHKVAIKFSPPVSGRFLLVKLWAGQSNVDVQSLVAKGFGGQRFFPAQQVK